MSELSDKLREARRLIEIGWTQDAWARDASLRGVLESDKAAICWCASGAMFRVSVKTMRGIHLIDFFADANGLTEQGVANWNDREGRTQAEVLAAFDKAIDLAERSA